jgi:hypothetical protein
MLSVEELNKLNEKANNVNTLKNFLEGIISSRCIWINLSYCGGTHHTKRNEMSVAAKDLIPHIQEVLNIKVAELAEKGVML